MMIFRFSSARASNACRWGLAHKRSKGYPEFVFELWASGAGDEQCAADMDLPIPKWQRLFWKIRGSVLCFLFGWWWWVKDNRTQQRVHPTRRSVAQKVSSKSNRSVKPTCG